jgi:hypothetical protein
MQENGPGDHKILRKNLKSAGCGCADRGAAAHHTVVKGNGPKVAPSGIDSQRILARCGINIDNAINGVCLPKNDNAKTAATRHKGQEGNIHGEAAQRAINTKLRDALREVGDNPDGMCSETGKAAATRVLRAIAKELTVGNVPKL